MASFTVILHWGPPPLGGAQALRNDMYILVQALVLISYFLAFTYRSQNYCQVPPQASRSTDGLPRRQKCQNMTVIGRIEEALTSQTIRSAACCYIVAALMLLPIRKPDVPPQHTPPVVWVTVL